MLFLPSHIHYLQTSREYCILPPIQAKLGYCNSNSFLQRRISLLRARLLSLLLRRRLLMFLHFLRFLIPSFFVMAVIRCMVIIIMSVYHIISYIPHTGTYLPIILLTVLYFLRSLIIQCMPSCMTLLRTSTVSYMCYCRCMQIRHIEQKKKNVHDNAPKTHVTTTTTSNYYYQQLLVPNLPTYHRQQTICFGFVGYEHCSPC